MENYEDLQELEKEDVGKLAQCLKKVQGAKLAREAWPPRGKRARNLQPCP